jgi:RimJ/RimL family protein N-acetyltransferase
LSITTHHQDVLASWLCRRIGLAPTSALQCIGRLNAAGNIMGVVGYDGYNGASVQMHVAGDGNWMSRELLWVAFDYPFNVMNCNVVLGLIPSGNKQALALNEHLGFQIDTVLPHAHPDGALVVMAMYRDACRWLKGHKHWRQQHACELLQ